HWNLPAEVCTVAAMHHAEGYWGECAGYVHVVQLANSLLKDLAIGDDLCLDNPAPLMESLGLAPDVAYEILNQVRLHASEVQSLARQLAACRCGCGVHRPPVSHYLELPDQIPGAQARQFLPTHRV